MSVRKAGKMTKMILTFIIVIVLFNACQKTSQRKLTLEMLHSWIGDTQEELSRDMGLEMNELNVNDHYMASPSEEYELLSCKGKLHIMYDVLSDPEQSTVYGFMLIVDIDDKTEDEIQKEYNRLYDEIAKTRGEATSRLFTETKWNDYWESERVNDTFERVRIEVQDSRYLQIEIRLVTLP